MPCPTFDGATGAEFWQNTPSADQRFIVYGRKRGHLKPSKDAWFQETLEKSKLPEQWSKADLWTPMAAERLCLEIGFGNGLYLSHLATLYPRDRFIGADIFLEGIASLLRKVQTSGLTNILVHVGPAQPMLASQCPPAALDRVVVNFPDPWPKTRHHKRRLIQPEFIDLLANRMSVGASLELATDWPHYADWMLAMLSDHQAFTNEAGAGHFATPPPDWLPTRFQDKGEAAGRPAQHLHFRRCAQ